jgi:hypothetical protein
MTARLKEWGKQKMPKPFLIGIEVEEVAFGAVVRKLNALDGVVRLHLDFDADKKKMGKGNGHSGAVRKDYGTTTGNDVVLKTLYAAKGPTPAREIGGAFAAAGRSPKSINSVLHSMQKDGDIQRHPDGGGFVLTKKARDRMRHRVSSKGDK